MNPMRVTIAILMALAAVALTSSYLVKRAEQGYAKNQYTLGVRYYNGDG